MNAVITFGLPAVPLITSNIVSDEPDGRTFGRVIRRIFFPALAANSFFLLVFALYKRRDISDAFLLLCESINIIFPLAALAANLFIIGILRYGTGFVRIRKTSVPVSILVPIVVSAILIGVSSVFRRMYGLGSIELLFFHMTLPTTGANHNMTLRVITKTIIDSTVLIILPLSALSFEVKFRNKYYHITKSAAYRQAAAMLFLACGICLFIVNTGMPSYVRSLRKEPSSFYEENYIDPNGVEIAFPAQRRNLIVIFIESLETGFLPRDNGGAFSERVIPELEYLIGNAINFSAGDGPGGAHELYGTEWTCAGIAAQYSGVPLAISYLDRSGWDDYGTLETSFLPGASGLGDILSGAGYKNYFILGSEIEFGGRDKYFKTHKDTVIYDYNYFRDNSYIPEDYRVWWGIEDRKLYALAKEKIAEIAGQNDPFFVTMLTADTHPSGGYLDDEAPIIFASQYPNVLFDMSRQLNGFLEWLKEQEFYENTTVVVLGDHLYQDSSIFPDDFGIHSLSSTYDISYDGSDVANKYKRFPVNIFINSLLSAEHAKNRIFSHFDIFPALVDSIGGVYDAKGLALGRSMNKGEPTLLETLGVEHVNDALQRRSDYYDRLWREKTKDAPD
ncbi:MAG: LTA synthase family protein [Treponema sp.]|jgi:phosphoglycerol transferase|nr:LTA synthase family protein [Treponema sp.]